MATTFEDSGEYLILVNPDGSGQQNFSTTALPGFVPLGFVSMGVESTEKNGLLTFSWTYTPTEREGILLFIGSGLEHRVSKKLTLTSDPSWWDPTNLDVGFPRWRWKIISKAL